MDPVKIGLIGCGNISDIYFKSGKLFKDIEIAACADLIPGRAQAKAELHGVPVACSVEELLAIEDIEIVLNLTVPKAHASVALAALEAGKHTHCEKPLALDRASGKQVLDLAAEKGLRVGCAPDTFLGAGIQTARKLIDDGWIGEPVAATAFMQCHGHESWHPDPEFYYEKGGGPMFDMGPYYLTALVNLLGPARRVCASARAAFPERTITSEKKFGDKIAVETPTHIAGTIDFANGAIATVITSFDVWAHTLPCLEIHGSTGSMSVPDPNCFGGAVKMRRAGAADWTAMPHSHPYPENSRGIGVADMACAIRTGREHRASGALAYHVLDIMCAFLDSSEQGRRIELESVCERPAPMPMDILIGYIENIY